MDIIG
jgi:hypothetical protein